MSRHKFVATSFSYFSASEKCPDILFFVATNLLFSHLRLLLQHNFLPSQHNLVGLHYCD